MMLSKTNPEQMGSHTFPETNIAPARKPSPKETSFEEGKFFCLFVSFLFRCTYKDGRVDHDAISDLGVSSWLFAV